MDIEVTRDVIESISEEARTASPKECCGILLGEGARIAAIAPAHNVHSTPETHFEIDPQALIDAHRAARQDGLQVLGYYHSHPHGNPHPSVTDRAMASGDGRIWAIIGIGRVMFWRDDPGGFRALSYAVIEA